MGKGIYNPVLSSSRFTSTSTSTSTYQERLFEHIHTHTRRDYSNISPILGIFVRTGYRGYGIRILSKTRGDKTKQIRIEVATARNNIAGEKRGNYKQKMPIASQEEQFKFLISCIRYSNNGKVSSSSSSESLI